MKLYTVSEPLPGDGIVTPGVTILPNENPMGLRWGELWRDSQHKEVNVVPLCKAQFRTVKGVVEAGVIAPTTVCYLVRADVVDAGTRGLRFELEQAEDDQRAFIYIRTGTTATRDGTTRGSAPEDAVPNTVTLTSNQARLVSEGSGPRDRVRRIYHPFSEVVGIKQLSTASVSIGGAVWDETLLILQPSASFRVVRGGDVRDLVPEFIVMWTGYKLRTVVPERYKSRVEGLRAEV